MDPFGYNSFFGVFNHFYYIKDYFTKTYSLRTRYPCLIDNPGFKDLLQNLNFADFGTFVMTSLAQFAFLTRYQTKGLALLKNQGMDNPKELYVALTKISRGNLLFSVNMGFLFALMNCYN